MSLPAALQTQLRCFSGRRVAWVLCLYSALLFPAHFFVSCSGSSALACDAILLAALSVLFCLISPAKTPGRFDPAMFALGLFLLHALAMH